MKSTNRLICRLASVAVLATLPFGMTTLAHAAPGSAPTTISIQTAIAKSPANDPYTADVLRIINQKRAAVGSPPVKWNQNVSNVSQDWAEHLGRATMDPNFDWSKIHRSDAGGSLIPAGATWYREIIGFNGSAQSIVDWWMGSSGHKAAMLDPKATDIGIGYVVPTSGPYAGWHQVVSNLAAYPQPTLAPSPPPSETVAPAPAPVPLPPEPAPAAITVTKTLEAIDTNGSLWSYSAPGNGTLGARSYQGDGWGSAKQIVKTDWNSDGILDLVARWRSGYVTMYAGIGNNDYKAPINIGAGWQDYDINAVKLKKTDKYPGLVARHIPTGKLYYYPNTTGKAMTAGRILIGTGGWTPMTELSAIDWDNNGNMDIVARNSVGQLKLYRTNGAGAFINESRLTIGNGWNPMTHIAVQHDFAGAGTTGIISRNSTGALFYYPINNGKFQSPKMIGSTGWNGYNIAAGTP